MYLGSFSRGKEIYLELNIKDKKLRYIEPDENPHAHIYENDFEGQREIAQVILNKIEDGYYTAFFEIPANIRITEYFIKYKVKINGAEFETKDRFKISEEHESFKKVEKDLSELFKTFGPKKEEENVFIYLKEIYNELKSKDEERVTVTSSTLLTKEGYNTVFMFNGNPLKNGRIVAYSTETDEIVEQAVSDEEGRWRMDIKKGSYRFVFMLPSGKILKKITEVV